MVQFDTLFLVCIAGNCLNVSLNERINHQYVPLICLAGYCGWLKSNRSGRWGLLGWLIVTMNCTCIVILNSRTAAQLYESRRMTLRGGHLTSPQPTMVDSQQAPTIGAVRHPRVTSSQTCFLTQNRWGVRYHCFLQNIMFVLFAYVSYLSYFVLQRVNA